MGPRTPPELADPPRPSGAGGETDRAAARHPAPVAGRFAAALVDWLLVALVGVALLAALPQVVYAATGGDAEAGMAGLALVPVALALFVAVYFGLAWGRTGRTIGMFVLSLHVVERRSGRAPAVSRALARTALTLATFASVLALVLAGGDAALLAGAATTAALALAGHVWTLLDRDRRSLQDRALGLAVERLPESDGSRIARAS